jgi:hypothetical protein
MLAHIETAVRHHFVLRDETLKKMLLPAFLVGGIQSVFSRTNVAVFCGAFAVGSLAVVPGGAPARWLILSETLRTIYRRCCDGS